MSIGDLKAHAHGDRFLSARAHLLIMPLLMGQTFNHMNDYMGAILIQTPAAGHTSIHLEKKNCVPKLDLDGCILGIVDSMNFMLVRVLLTSLVMWSM